ncbi:MAG: aminotransferase class I/II-fold pyridoxal phosphate-dependent enzyme [Phycisphaerales bacterium]|nr:aminotransferase class I/II-fold pyridoxal phosphate-dependent enzyme [Phycisphaerales bacterium]MCB9856355.1 aminotransferase class I/II-fold pyridoxal phosphate-dependent enzyme [Phycisphaerales bacterium]MCB9864027.1 aminotransferase class I/II-fold pyridoxal phosphate-dependent enzyme [Phycisphaerales bacterium]
MKLATQTIHFAQESESETGAVTAPIFQTSTFQQIAPGRSRGYDYARTNNPTRARLETVLAGLEGVEHAAVFASGLAAENAIFQAYLSPGDRIIVPPDVYGGTHRLLYQSWRTKGIDIVAVDYENAVSLSAALTTNTRLVWLESPTNPRLLIYDIAAVSAAAHAVGALVVVDNTFATPVFQQPFQLGADIVVHSVTKYLAGHSDVIQGAVLAKDAAVFQPIKFLQNAGGAVPGPFDCWLTLRGLKTLEVRVLRHAENARRIAEALVDHPAVSRVFFPGLADHPGHEIARRQATGFGGIVSIEIDAPLEAVQSFVSNRRYFMLAESLGGVKSLICHPATMTHAAIPAADRTRLGLSDRLVRISPGIEDGSDLVSDLVEGLNALSAIREGESNGASVGAMASGG